MWFENDARDRLPWPQAARVIVVAAIGALMLFGIAGWLVAGMIG